MISPISQNNNNKTQASIFYMNDFHAKLPNLERLYSASKAFDSFETTADKMKFSSGDDSLGEDPAVCKAVSKLLDMIGIQKRQNGNHEYDVNPKIRAEISKQAGYKELGAVNMHIKPAGFLENTLISSSIQEVNGNRYGVLGIGPSDLDNHLKEGASKDELKVDDINLTIVNLQKEVDKLKSQNLDKIILLSHSGYANDKRIAKETRGIDVILGGHSHHLLEGVVKDKNLFYNLDGEPVVITQAGKDGEYFGVLNLEFNEKGIITKAQNNVTPTKNFNRALQAKYTVEAIIGKPEPVGVINSAPPNPKNRLIENNPHTNFVTDAMRIELDTDIALLNAANIRGFFEKGKIDSRQVSEISPFKNKMVIANLSEKDIVDAIKLSGKSFTSPGKKPGIVMPSGLTYKMTNKGELLELNYIDKQGKTHPIDINNPNPNKMYRTAMDDFFANGGNGMYMLNKIKTAEAVFEFDKDKLTCDYIRKMNKPVDIIDDKRIEIIEV